MAKIAPNLFRYLSENFNLKKYEKSNELSIVDWFNELSARNDSLALFDELDDSDMCSAIRNSFLSSLPYLRPLGPKRSFRPTQLSSAIEDLKLFEINTQLNEKLEREQLISILSGDWQAVRLQPIRFSRDYTVLAMDRRYPDKRLPAITVDLRASDEDLILEFKNWLYEKRKSQKDIGFREKMFGEKEFSDWIKNRILPYLDLTIIAKAKGIKITNALMGNLLFPDDIEVDVAEKVRKTVKPMAKKVMSIAFLDALQFAAFIQTKNLPENYTKDFLPEEN
jgi:hypothetical protein